MNAKAIFNITLLCINFNLYYYYVMCRNYAYLANTLLTNRIRIAFF